MKKLFYFTSLIGLVCASCAGNENSIRGVWQYVEDDQLQEVNGMSFFTSDHFAFVVNYDKSDSSQDILAYSGTYILEDTLVTATIQHAQNPGLVGKKLKWIHRTDGEEATYEVLDQKGNVVEKGKVIRVE